MDLVKFESPSTLIISGMTGSGKTTWLYKLLQCKDVIFKDPPNKIIYCYSIWTKLFDSMEKDLDMEFVQGAPNAEKIKAIYDGKHHIMSRRFATGSSKQQRGCETVYAIEPP